eukprot:1322831-Rhodomonas_salina.1
MQAPGCIPSMQGRTRPGMCLVAQQGHEKHATKNDKESLYTRSLRPDKNLLLALVQIEDAHARGRLDARRPELRRSPRANRSLGAILLPQHVRARGRALGAALHASGRDGDVEHRHAEAGGRDVASGAEAS